MTAPTTAAPYRAHAINPRTLIPTDLYDRLVARIADEHATSAEYADRVMSQSLAFLTACAHNRGPALSPSPQVDIGWHTFILYTREYEKFCHTVAGRFIHHVPDDAPGVGERHPEAERYGATVEAMRAAGLPVDAELWIPASKCSQCHAGCFDDTKTED